MDITRIIRSRYTSKAYTPGRGLTDEQREQLLELLHLSPSSVNSQPWHFFVIESAEAKARILPAFNEANVAKVQNAAMVVVFTIRTEMSEDHLHALLAKEQQDGRFSSEEAKAGQDAGRRYFVKLNSGSLEQQRNWMARQAYLSLGFLLLGAASMGLGATPVEGFTPQAMDELLNLHEQGLQSVVVATIGHRSEEDFNARLPKSRLPRESVITRL
ncbi:MULTISPECIES: oxygen-insensitive NAD(P)H nitroreductase [Tenebrionibacter/Tenebrionicola group]|jgi:nitroreductase/dihydropteridine reductase|uniref:Oxygen-insensitive NAD(P)H nitroreductase n=2 Tax=Tenebrionibacter/Tenebrionicola group TaxID=2969848 RepID=A0A8K0V2E8_9ENTR|nr:MULTISPECIES: oxygen-insensitive NAD(P)H nitroreductase [Tenebrionibacter/Tenebrionicola group]MBK4716229.1 oxygen-insensitive NAD(P)H nitroreductase [Tenebrionibacter intestinalis]MBV5096884.1 oxygen-insensitive NAD(P)H nitroreductase [Tenebrionicola larvae]